ncbi:hypothetical protein [Mucilaginibacter sp.]|uniref:hypothetical protein n=1 Tax=Mucilaginibacter sp. TaxID=1882438 RepID=UPI002844DDBE|nr:hypothetical protein [Mucilaginibacter sp.]MDR3693879.1 hypothetical protein [Mucilaginibacter sp.]
MLIAFVVWLFYVRLCAKLGAKRVVGGINGAFYGIFFSYTGIFFVLSSRKLLDDKANAALLAKYKQVTTPHPET